MQINLDGKVALVTGAASGIGRAVALALHEAGARVAGLDRDAAGLVSLARVTGGFAADGDVLKEESLASAIRLSEAALGPVDILVTAAGVLQRLRDIPVHQGVCPGGAGEHSPAAGLCGAALAAHL